ncbi:hypothetical protein JFL47_13870 [Haemophilus haemoglobinophilus]|nr:hypothetical protein [Canicola haemoglobinophilus]MBN6712283.1 hypothetical protein [Canicola haemoglobinophilus]
MKKVFFILMSLISFNVLSNVILYDDERFSLIDFNNEKCHLLKVRNKTLDELFILKSNFIDAVDLSKENCVISENSHGISIKFYPSDSYDINNNHLLKLNYDLNSEIFIDNEYKNVNFSRCTIINLEKIEVVADSAARENICAEDNFHIYIEDN